MDVKASQLADLPEDLDGGTMYFIDNLDSTATQYVTSESGVPRRILGGVLTESAVGRTGTLSARLTRTGTTLAQQFTPTTNMTLGTVTLERTTLSAGTATLNVWSATGAVIGTATATAQGGGLTATLNTPLTGGVAYFIGGQGIGGTLTTQLSSGHTWPGLSLSSTALYTSVQSGAGGIVGEENGAPTAQLPLQFGVGSTAVRRVTVNGPLYGTVVGDSLAVSLGDGRLADELTRTGGGTGTTYPVNPQNGLYAKLTLSAPLTLAGWTVAHLSGAGPAVSRVWQATLSGSTVTGGTQLAEVTSTVADGQAEFRPAGALSLAPGTYLIGVRGVGLTQVDLLRAPDGQGVVYAGVPYAPGVYSPASSGAPPTDFNDWNLGDDVSLDLRLYQRATSGVPMSSVELLVPTLAGHETRLTALEARPLIDTEVIQDIAATMLGSVGVYNDAAGTYTITLPSARTDEEIQDVVAALIQAGTNVTKTYDDAGNVLTISATGGTAPVTSVAGRTGAVVLTSADLSDFNEAVQDAAASMLADSTDLDGVYADGSNTFAYKVTGIQNKAVPDTGTAGQSIRLNSGNTAWEFYTPSSITVQNSDASVSGTPTTLKFASGTLSIASGVATYTPPASSGGSSGPTEATRTGTINNNLPRTDTNSYGVFNASSSTVLKRVALSNATSDMVPADILIRSSDGSTLLARVPASFSDGHLVGDFPFGVTVNGNFMVGAGKASGTSSWPYHAPPPTITYANGLSAVPGQRQFSSTPYGAPDGAQGGGATGAVMPWRFWI